MTRNSEKPNQADSKAKSQISGANLSDSQSPTGRQEAANDQDPIRVGLLKSAPQSRAQTDSQNPPDTKAAQAVADSWSENLVRPSKSQPAGSSVAKADDQAAGNAPRQDNQATGQPALGQKPSEAELQIGAKIGPLIDSQVDSSPDEVKTSERGEWRVAGPGVPGQHSPRGQGDDRRLDDVLPTKYLNDAIQETEAEQNEYDSLNPFQSQEWRHNFHNSLPAVAHDLRPKVVEEESEEPEESFEFTDDNEDEQMDGPVLSAVLNGFILAKRHG